VTAVRMPLLSAGHTAALLERVLYEEARACVRMGRLSALEEMLAIELLQVEAIEDGELLPIVREMLVRAFAQVIERRDRTSEEEARTRYTRCLWDSAAPPT
jgi:hypothetical protein